MLEGGVFTGVFTRFAVLLFAVPLGFLWGFYLLFVTVMTARELWKGRRKRRRKRS